MKNKPIEEIMNDRFSNRLSDKQIDDPKWNYRWIISCPKDLVRELIQAKIDEGCRVKCGWCSTAVRGYHHYTLMWKFPAKQSEIKVK